MALTVNCHSSAHVTMLPITLDYYDTCHYMAPAVSCHSSTHVTMLPDTIL